MDKVARPARVAAILAAAVVRVLLMIVDAAAASAAATAGCSDRCGNISIPYPFGVEPGCYHVGGFNLTCNQSYHPPKLFLGDGTVQVLDISIPNATVRINSTSIDFDLGTQGANGTWRASNKGTNGTWRAGRVGYAAGPYFLGEDQNNLVAFACDVRAVLLRENNTIVSTCAPFCPKDDEGRTVIGAGDLCSGVGCCQAIILEGRASYGLQLYHLDFDPSSGETYASVFIADSDYSFNMSDYYDQRQMTVPAILGWTITSSACHSNGSSPSCLSKNSFCQNYSSYFSTLLRGHNCWCSDGYEGNPYISNGCYDINECDHSDTYPCYGDCKNTQGGYGCECPPGFKGNASEKNGCEDIDECKHSEVYPCSDGKCINMPGTFHCWCHDGTYWDPLIKHGCVRGKKSFTGLSIALVIIGGTISLLLALAAPFIARKIKLNRRNKQK